MVFILKWDIDSLNLRRLSAPRVVAGMHTSGPWHNHQNIRACHPGGHSWLCITGPLWGESTGFPSQRACDAEGVSLLWCHHVMMSSCISPTGWLCSYQGGQGSLCHRARVAAGGTRSRLRQRRQQGAGGNCHQVGERLHHAKWAQVSGCPRQNVLLLCDMMWWLTLRTPGWINKPCFRPSWSLSQRNLIHVSLKWCWKSLAILLSWWSYSVY